MGSASVPRMAVEGDCVAVGERCIRRDSGEGRVRGLKEERQHLSGDIRGFGARRKSAADDGVGR